MRHGPKTLKQLGLIVFMKISADSLPKNLQMQTDNFHEKQCQHLTLYFMFAQTTSLF